MDNPVSAFILRRMKHDCDILIVGGGLNGPALALALAGNGLRITIVDSLPVTTRTNPAFDGRAYALALATRRMLAALNIWPVVENNSQPILDIVVSDGRPGEGAAPWALHFDHREIEEGPMGHMLEDRYLRRALLDAVAANPDITQISDATVIAQTVHPTHVSVTCNDGKSISAGLLVGCDGRNSGTARRAGILRSGWDYGQTALVCAVNHERPHYGAAHQFFMPSGPLGILPLPGNRCSIVWAEDTAKADHIKAMSDADFLAELRPRFGEYLGDITLEGDRFSYPLSLSLANSMTAGRTVLVGDAAHGVHPLAGQGLNLGLRDVAALSEVLIHAQRRGEDFAAVDVLERYARWRRFDTASMAAATDSINRLFSNDNSLLRAGRDIGLGAVNAVPALRRAFIRNAAGLTGELPKLMAGQKI